MAEQQPFVWDRLGVDDGGLPTHLPMGVNKDGQGPEDDAEAHHYECWCIDPDCPLTAALRQAWEAGRRVGHDDAETVLTMLNNDSGWEGQGPSMGFAATFSQELTERPDHARQQNS